MALFLGACSTSAAVSDAKVGADLAPCEPAVYPCGPYGSDRGAVVADLSLKGYLDPDYLCRAEKDASSDRSQLRSFSLGDFHRGSPRCSAKNKALLWINVSAGWCPSCASEASAIQQSYSSGNWDPRLGFFSALFDTEKYGQPADEAFLKTWTAKLGLSFPVAIDPEFLMGRFFGRNVAPFNLLVDLKTMKVVFRQAGAGLSTIKAEIGKRLP